MNFLYWNVRDFAFLDSFAVSANCRSVKDIILVLWKAPSSPWLKVNTDGSVIGGHAACGGLFHDSLGTFRSDFYCNIGIQTVFYAEVLGIILAIGDGGVSGCQPSWDVDDAA
ncbi:transmembrane protein, putative [Medicago truncatula]|uniref:Transmembrane protein, putative n=1 Tax=Medicago truncatula TaxID=3880 RepID=A0A072V811_MEDTR|nr:transmembrane protein, putative [Medicago truncatula]